MNEVIKAKDIELIVESRGSPIIHKTNLNILSGEFVVILGHNGSGKSSLIKILSGVRKPTSGEVIINQQPLLSISPLERSKEIIMITQNPGDRLFLELTLKENIILWESRFPISMRLGVDQILNTSYNPARFKALLNNPVGTLSGGEKQAFLMNLALVHPPSMLFLDEHTSALDPKASKEIMRLTADYIGINKVTTIMVTHSLQDALLYGNRLIIMNEGVITRDFFKSIGLSENDLKEMMD